MKPDFPRLKVSPELRRKMLEVARQFRKEPTPSERILWQALRGRKLDGVKFRRQQPIGPFVVDFYNSDYRLIIEVDGPIHNYQVEADKARQEMLEILGFTILHLKAEMVEMNLGAAMTLIRAKIRDFEQFSLPRMGEGQGGG
jgi:very-short-patch-repair endonuclease